MTAAGPILIAGGGIGGLAAAIALAGAGQRVHVIEQRRDLSEEGAGIQIGPNGVHALRRLGVADRLEALVGQPRQIAILDGRTGRCLSRLPLAPRMQAAFGAPYWVARRADLHAVLLARARTLGGAIEITTGFRIASIDKNLGEGVQVRRADGTTITGRALVGADGLHSLVARTVLGAAAPFPTGRGAARAVLPAGDLGPPFDDAVTGLWLGPRAHLVHYPVDGGRLVNVVAIVAGDRRPSAEVVRSGSGQDDAAIEWGGPVTSRAVLSGFDGWCPPVIALLARAPGWRRWSLLERPVLDRWSDDAVTVLGDAAHPVPPFLAQGAVLALEDAVALAQAVSATPDDIAAAFRRYAAHRQARTARVARASRRNGSLYHLGGVAAAARNTVLSWLPPERLIAGYDWLYGYRGPEAGGAPPSRQPTSAEKSRKNSGV